MPTYYPAAKFDDIPEGGGLCVQLQGKKIGLFKHQGQIYAIDDTCPHADASLSEGEIQDSPSGCEVLCPLHYAAFNLKTGECTAPPADEDLTPYPIRITNGTIEIEL